MAAAIGQQQISQLVSSLKQLGIKRLTALGVVGLIVFIGIIYGARYLSQPAHEVLYSGLESQDVGRMASALERAGIDFDVNPEGSSILVPFGKTARARMILAQQGLPSGSSSGYELFDQLGSMGLTSFMQEVTRVRALEGEIARTVQSIEGVQAARVHLVMPDGGSFRRKRRSPSGSVVVRMIGSRGEFTGTQAIRHLVAAAVPGMKIEDVSVLSTDGAVLAAAGDASVRAPHTMLELEQKMSRQIEEAAGRTLAPYLGLGNYQVSVALRLNTDRRNVREQTFDPDSRVERSVRVVKQEGSTENRAANPAVGVDQNIPQEEGGGAGGDQSKRQEERREELTNYELNSRLVNTESNGYRLENMTLAVLVNRKQVMSMLGNGATDELLEQQLVELKRVISAATGISEDRGDRIEVSAVDFLADGNQLQPIPEVGVAGYLMRNIGTIINASAALAIVFLVLVMAVRPALGVLREMAPQAALEDGVTVDASGGGGDQGQLEPSSIEAELLDDLAIIRGDNIGRLPPPKERLEKLIELDEEQFVLIMKQWIREGEGQI
ncbi:MAG: flagellar basal-body MS-ring/collar protein FliF [Filomicrobium sp.]